MLALLICSGVVLYAVGLLITYHFWLALDKKYCEYCEKRYYSCDHEFNAAIACAFWPLSWPLVGLWMLGVGIWDWSSQLVGKWADSVVNKKKEDV